MKLLYIIFCWFSCQTVLSAHVLWQQRRNFSWISAGRYSAPVLGMAMLALVFSIIWGFLVLNAWEVPSGFFWGFIIAYLIYLWIKDHQARIAILISNVAMITTASLLWAFYFEIISAGPYSNYFGMERLAVFKPGHAPNMPSLAEFKEFGMALGHAGACGLSKSELTNALENMADGLEKTYEAGGLDKEEYNEIRGQMMTEWARAWVGQRNYSNRIKCGDAISKWIKMKKIMPL